MTKRKAGEAFGNLSVCPDGEVGCSNRRSLPGCLQSGRAGPGPHRLCFLPLCKRMDGSGVWVCVCVSVLVCVPVCVPCTAVILFSKAEPGLGPSLALKDNNRRSIPVRVRMYVCVCFVQWPSHSGTACLVCGTRVDSGVETNELSIRASLAGKGARLFLLHFSLSARLSLSLSPARSRLPALYLPSAPHTVPPPRPFLLAQQA